MVVTVAASPHGAGMTSEPAAGFGECSMDFGHRQISFDGPEKL